MSIISNYSLKDECIKFQINNSKGDYKICFPNTLRRILISYIECYTIDFDDVKFIENNSLFNNEFLKKRLSLIPIMSNNNHNYEFLEISCNKSNNNELIEDIFTSDFKIKDRTTDKELNINDFISDSNILFSKLQMNQTVNFQANLKKNDAFKGGSSHSIVSSCVVTFHNSNYEKDGLNEKDRNYDLNKKNEPKIYDFYCENIGFYKSNELIKITCNVLIEKLNEFRGKFDNYEFLNDFYYILVKDENDTLGNLFCSYFLENKEIKYCGYNIEHPLKNNISIKIKIDGKKDQLFKLIEKTIDNLINMVKELLKNFK